MKVENQQKGYCRFSVLSMYAKASHKSDIVSQLLFGETYEIEKIEGDWVRVCCHHDSYSGYILKAQHSILEGTSSPTTTKSLYGQLYEGQKLVQTIFMGSQLHTTMPWSYIPISNIVQQNGDLRKTLLYYALQYKDVPYLWGGRSPQGIDCSGLVQLTYRMIGHALPRDAYQQAALGSEVAFEERKIGDLAFFGNKEGKITHVGICMDNAKILHASAWVRVDELREEGIFYQGEQSHQLFFIKKIVD